MYSLSGFDVTRSHNEFRLSDSPVSIRFADGTASEELTDSGNSIPTEMFRFHSYDQLPIDNYEMQFVISTNDYKESMNITTNLSQLHLDLRLQLPKLPSINTYTSYPSFRCQGLNKAGRIFFHRLRHLVCVSVIHRLRLD